MAVQAQVTWTCLEFRAPGSAWVVIGNKALTTPPPGGGALGEGMGAGVGGTSQGNSRCLLLSCHFLLPPFPSQGRGWGSPGTDPSSQSPGVKKPLCFRER